MKKSLGSMGWETEYGISLPQKIKGSPDWPDVGRDSPAAEERGGGDAVAAAEGLEFEVPEEEGGLLGEADHPVQAPQDGAGVEAVWEK